MHVETVLELSHRRAVLVCQLLQQVLVVQGYREVLGHQTQHAVPVITNDR